MGKAVLAALLLLAACAPSQGLEQSQGRQSHAPGGAVAIENVTILPMTDGGDAIANGAILIRGDRIVAVGRTGEFTIPASARRIDGRGRYLMPALADMHVHIESSGLIARMTGVGPPLEFDTGDLLLPYVANGVLQVFNLASDTESLAQRNAVESGRVLGPHIALAVMVDGDPPIIPPMARTAANPEAGRALVAAIEAEGFDAVKTYSNLDLPTFRAIVDEAARRDLPVLGHIPLREAGRTEELFGSGFSMVAHAEEFAYQTARVDESRAPAFAALARERGVWLITTLKLNERVVEMTVEDPALLDRAELRFVHPLTRRQWSHNNTYARSRERLARRQAVTRFNPVLLRAFAEAGVPLIVGTDTPVAGSAPGFALHDELEALAAIGLPNRLILEGATRLPAEWLGVSNDRGVIEPGKRADLLLLDADPLADVANTRAIAAVIVSGRVLTRAELDRRMEALAARYEAMAPVEGRASLVEHHGHHDE